MDLAQESDQVKKARAKLAKQLEGEKKLITPEALNEVQDKIYRWIERHSRDRVNLRDRNVALVSLFDTNEHPAKTTSKFVQNLRNQIQTDIVPAEGEKAPDMSSLKGRIRRVEKNPSQDSS